MATASDDGGGPTGPASSSRPPYNPDLLSSDEQPYHPPHQRGDESDSNYVSMELAQVPPVVNKENSDDYYNNYNNNGDNDDYDGDNDDDDDVSLAPSIVSSVMTADGIHDVTGFYCVCLVILVGDMSRGVFFPSLWPLVESLGGTPVTLGYAVAAFSFGRILVNPLFGSWSHQIGYSKTLNIACCLLLVGTLVYAQVQNIGRPEFLIVAQTMLGVGSGTLGVTRAFVADVTAKRNRTTYMAWITAVQYGGFTVTPCVGAFFNKVLGNVDYRFGFFRFNMYTAPAYFMFLMVAGTLVVLFVFFRHRQRIDTIKPLQRKKSQKQTTIDEVANTITFTGLSIYDCCILGCMLLNISTKGSIASFETLGIAIAESQFNMASSRAGIIVAACGSIGVFSLLSMGKLSQYLSDVELISGGMLVMTVGIISLATIADKEGNPGWRYFLAIFLIYSIGYPIGHTAVIGLFSKIVGRRPQGTLLGWFASAGSLARMLFPIMSGYIASFKGVETLFLLLICVLLVSTVFVLWARQTLTLLSS